MPRDQQTEHSGERMTSQHTPDREQMRDRWREIASRNAFAYNPEYINEGTLNALLEGLQTRRARDERE